MKENDNLEKVKNGEFKFEEKKNKKKKSKVSTINVNDA